MANAEWQICLSRLAFSFLVTALLSKPIVLAHLRKVLQQQQKKHENPDTIMPVTHHLNNNFFLICGM